MVLFLRVYRTDNWYNTGMKNPMEMTQGDIGHKNIGDQEKIPLEDIQSWQNKSFFQRLGVSNMADEDEIKKSFRTLSLKYHPDKVHNNDVLRANYQEVYKLITEAYKALTRPDKNNASNNENEILEKVNSAIMRLKTARIVYLSREDTCVELKKLRDTVEKLRVGKEKILSIIDAEMVHEFKSMVDHFLSMYGDSLYIRDSIQERPPIDDIKDFMSLLLSLGIEKNILIQSIKGQKVDGKEIANFL